MSTQFETLDDYVAEQLQDPGFRAEWEALEPAYQIARVTAQRVSGMNREPLPGLSLRAKRSNLPPANTAKEKIASSLRSSQ